jgi:hypothetical protein
MLYSNKDEKWIGVAANHDYDASAQTAFHTPADRVRVVPEILTRPMISLSEMEEGEASTRCRTTLPRLHHRKLAVKAEYFLSKGPLFLYPYPSQPQVHLSFPSPFQWNFGPFIQQKHPF